MMVSIKKKLPVLGSNILKYKQAIKQTTLPKLYFFCLKNALCKNQFTFQYNKRMEERFYLLVGLPHQCLLLSQDPMESGHHEFSFEDQLHAVRYKQTKKNGS